MISEETIAARKEEAPRRSGRRRDVKKEKARVKDAPCCWVACKDKGCEIVADFFWLQNRPLSNACFPALAVSCCARSKPTYSPYMATDLHVQFIFLADLLSLVSIRFTTGGIAGKLWYDWTVQVLRLNSVLGLSSRR